MKNVVLIAPRIATNIGNIGRTCLGFGARLHLVKPLVDVRDEARIRKAGLDYWKHVDFRVYEDIDSFANNVLPTLGTRYLFSKFTENSNNAYDVTFEGPGADIALVFGSESHGLDELAPEHKVGTFLYFPMVSEHIRSHNLANSVAMGLSEVSRQHHIIVEARNCDP